MTNKPSDTCRSHEFIQSFQLDGLCQALRLLVSQTIHPGAAARRLLKTIRDDFVARTRGRAIDVIPDVSDVTTPADLYVIAELIRSTNFAFLSPEEIADRRIIGFHNSQENSIGDAEMMLQIARRQARQSGLKKSDVERAVRKVRRK